MKWAHLPAAGGLYDQHPALLSEWLVIFEVEAEEQKRQEAKEKIHGAPAGKTGKRARR